VAARYMAYECGSLGVSNASSSPACGIDVPLVNVVRCEELISRPEGSYWKCVCVISEYDQVQHEHSTYKMVRWKRSK